MPWPKIVCPNNEALLRKFSGRSVAVTVNNAAEAGVATENVRHSGNSCVCVIVRAHQPLDQLQLRPEDARIPIALVVPTAGRFRNLARKIDELRKFNLRVYLPCDSPENIASLRILSSLGIETCAMFGGGVDWNALTDLMTYALLDYRMPHAPMQPFEFIASTFDPCSSLHWDFLWFDDPTHFVHVDDQGRVALSDAELREQCFVAQDLTAISDPSELPALKARRRLWTTHFVQADACSSCEGWSLCHGKFAETAAHATCSEFFAEVKVVARQHKLLAKRPPQDGVWQL